MAVAEILIALSQVTPMLMQILLSVVSILIGSLTALIPICVSRAKNIPTHIRVLVEIFQNQGINSQAKKILAVILLGLSGIIPFITFSIIPFTGVPVIGFFTFPIACLLSFILVCLSYELVVIPVLKSGSINIEGIKPELEKFRTDYLAVRNTLGPKWEKFVSKAKKIIEENSKSIEKFGRETDVKMMILCEKVVEYIEPSIKELNIYLDSGGDIELSEEELNIIQEKMTAWKKVAISGAASVGAGIGSAAAAKSVLVPTTLWTSLTHSLGLGSGILVSGGTYAAASIYAPVAIGGLSFYLCLKGFKKVEKNRLSDFLADVIISSLPMTIADGKFDEKEAKAVEKITSNPAINDKDRLRIKEAIEYPVDIEEIVSKHLMFEKNGKKAKIKARMLLSIAWDIARSDGKIHDKEIEMHEKMARVFQVESNYCQEVRNLLSVAAT